MANSNKSIVITPNTGSTTADPKIVFSGADASTAAQNITMTVYPANNGTLSIDGSAGQLFSVSNSLTGTLFSVNDISGVPSIEVLDTGVVKLAQYNGSVAIGTTTTVARLNVLTGLRVQAQAGTGYRADFYNNSTATYFNSYNDTLTAYQPVQFSASNYNFSAGSAGTISALTIDTSGNVGINSTPTTKLDIGGTTTGPTLTFSQTAGNTGGRQMFGIGYRTGSYAGGVFVAGITEGTFDDTVGLRFYTAALAERMRIDSSGNVLVGTTSATPASGITILPGTGLNSNVGVHHASGAPSGTFYVGFNYNSVNIGGITQNGTTAVAFNTTSDARRKQNIVDAPSAIQKVKGIQVRSFDWISDSTHVEHGLVAQELQTVAPEAVHVGGDDADTAPWAVDQSKLVPILVKALQEALARIEALEAKLA
jgi:hypothetical protein